MEIYVLKTKFCKKDVLSQGQKKESVIAQFATTASDGKTKDLVNTSRNKV